MNVAAGEPQPDGSARPGAFLIGYDVESANPDVTRPFLRRVQQIHEATGVPATFFLCGRTVEKNVNALRGLASHFRGRNLENTVVVSPDLGNAKPAEAFARLLGVPVAAGIKQRVADDRVVITSIVGDVSGRDVIVLDDEIANAGTLVELLDRLREHRVGRIDIACTHGLFTGQAIARLRQQEDVAEIVTTNTVPISEEKRLPHMTVLSIAPLLAEAIRRIHYGESVSELFAPHY